MVFVITPLPHPFVLYAPFTGRSSLSLGLGQLWLTLDHFRLLALPVGIALHHQLHSFIHTEHLYSASSRGLLRDAPDSSTAKKSSLKLRKKRR